MHNRRLSADGPLSSEAGFSEQFEPAAPPTESKQFEDSPGLAVLTEDNLIKLQQAAPDNLVVYFSQWDFLKFIFNLLLR